MTLQAEPPYYKMEDWYHNGNPITGDCNHRITHGMQLYTLSAADSNKFLSGANYDDEKHRFNQVEWIFLVPKWQSLSLLEGQGSFYQG